MCLGVPGEVTAINGHEAVVDFWGVEQHVRIDVVGDPIEVGDYILDHAGFAIRKIPEEEVERTMAIYESLFEDDASDAINEIGLEDDVDLNLTEQGEVTSQ